ncbi:MAG: hypothetical protein DMG31_14985 [Acidobacteria bacterium]|nr:MAG: hypothetical protein DMG31_14985 [Acidobacteriota bacterium]
MSMITRTLVSGSLTRVIDTIWTALVSLLIMPFVVHALGDRMYGIWTLVATFAGYYGLVELGLSQAITQYLSRSLGSLDTEEFTYYRCASVMPDRAHNTRRLAP